MTRTLLLQAIGKNILGLLIDPGAERLPNGNQPVVRTAYQSL